MKENSENIFIDMSRTFVEAFSGQLMILVGLYILVFMVVMLDLWSGVRKARRRGELRTSFGLRKTVEKLARYFNLMMVISVIDAMQMLAVYHVNSQISFRIPIIPFLSICEAIFIGIIELKSIYEKAEDKDKGKYQEAAKLVKQLLANKEAQSILTNVTDYLKKNEEHYLQENCRENRGIWNKKAPLAKG